MLLLQNEGGDFEEAFSHKCVCVCKASFRGHENREELRFYRF